MTPVATNSPFGILAGYQFLLSKIFLCLASLMLIIFLKLETFAIGYKHRKQIAKQKLRRPLIAKHLIMLTEPPQLN